MVIGASTDPELLTSAANADLLLGKLDEARGLYERAVQASSDERSPTTKLAYVYTKLNLTGKAQSLLAASLRRDLDLLAGGDETANVRFDIAEINAVQGNAGEACRWLQKAIDAGMRDFRLPVVDPLFERVRDQQQFKDIIGNLKRSVDPIRQRWSIQGLDREASS